MIGAIILLLVAMLLVQRFCKKKLRMILLIILCLSLLYSIIFTIDKNRVESFREPVFNIGYYEESGMIEYKGLGYRTVVKYVYTLDEEKRITSIEMYMFDKCIAGAIE